MLALSLSSLLRTLLSSLLWCVGGDPVVAPARCSLRRISRGGTGTGRRLHGKGPHTEGTQSRSTPLELWAGLWAAVGGGVCTAQPLYPHAAALHKGPRHPEEGRLILSSRCG